MLTRDQIPEAIWRPSTTLGFDREMGTGPTGAIVQLTVFIELLIYRWKNLAISRPCEYEAMTQEALHRQRTIWTAVLERDIFTGTSLQNEMDHVLSCLDTLEREIDEYSRDANRIDQPMVVGSAIILQQALLILCDKMDTQFVTPQMLDDSISWRQH